MERPPHRHGLVAAGSIAGELQRHPYCRRTAGREQDLAQGIGRDRGETLCQLDRNATGVAARAKGQQVELRLDRRDHGWVAVAHLVDAVAVEVEDAPPSQVGEPRALGTFDDVEARRRKRLVKEDLGVRVQERARRLVDVVAQPAASQRRGVDVALASVAPSRSGPLPARQRALDRVERTFQIPNAVDDMVAASARELAVGGGAAPFEIMRLRAPRHRRPRGRRHCRSRRPRPSSSLRSALRRCRPRCRRP